MREIIANVLEAVGLNRPGFAKAIGLPIYPWFYNLQSGRTKKFRPAIADPMVKAFPRLNLEYLYTGKGNVLKDEIPSEKERVNKFCRLLETASSNFNKDIRQAGRTRKRRRNDLNDKERKLNLKELELMKT